MVEYVCYSPLIPQGKNQGSRLEQNFKHLKHLVETEIDTQTYSAEEKNQKIGQLTREFLRACSEERGKGQPRKTDSELHLMLLNWRRLQISDIPVSQEDETYLLNLPYWIYLAHDIVQDIAQDEICIQGKIIKIRPFNEKERYELMSAKYDMDERSVKRNIAAAKRQVDPKTWRMTTNEVRSGYTAKERLSMGLSLNSMFAPARTTQPFI